MLKRYELTPKGNGWAIMAHDGAGAVTDAGWVSLGKSPSQMVAMRVYLALKARGDS